ncbi:transposase, partial [Megasphaera sp. BL7]|uniref:transposase n=1 Tax=Megasphaera sp. BL7 TaxID=1285585 RepID=UPI000358292E
MPRKKYTSEFKTKIVLSILQGDKEFNVICSENGLNPNMVRKWKQEFLTKCPSCL